MSEENASGIVCPVCGFYCLGKGGVGCIDKPSMQKGEAMSELKPCPDKRALEIAIDFAEKFQKNYPITPLYQMVNELAWAIHAVSEGKLRKAFVGGIETEIGFQKLSNKANWIIWLNRRFQQFLQSQKGK